MGGDADISVPAALLGDRSRARVLLALSDGRALPASVLATEAGVGASTVSGHLAKLCEAGMLSVERHGRHRYYRITSPQVVRALEALAEIAPQEPIRSLRQHNRAHALRQSRLCYDHLAGRLGVALMRALIDRGVLAGGDGAHHPERAQRDRLSAAGHDIEYRLTDHGAGMLTELGIDLDKLGRRRRPLIRYCLDWTEQRHHLAGALGAALADRLFELDWLRHTSQRRAVQLTDAGSDGLSAAFGFDFETHIDGCG
jgi:DNA-binding transcriptional ArsR family regulator